VRHSIRQKVLNGVRVTEERTTTGTVFWADEHGCVFTWAGTGHIVWMVTPAAGTRSEDSRVPLKLSGPCLTLFGARGALARKLRKGADHGSAQRAPAH